MIANRRCCRLVVLGLLHGFCISKSSLTYRMTTLTDREISPTRLIPKQHSVDWYIPDLVGIIANPTKQQLSDWRLWQQNHFPTNSLSALPVTETDVTCPDDEAEPLPSIVFRRKTRSPLMCFISTFLPTPWPSSGFFIVFYSMSLPHAVFPVLLSCVFGCSNGSLDIIQKALVWTYRTRTMTQKTQASV